MKKKKLAAIALVIIPAVALWYFVSNFLPDSSQDLESSKKADRTIETKEGDNFSIILGSNHSTGYEWEFDYDEGYVELIDQKFQEPPRPTGFLGGGEMGNYIFQAKKSGETQITANYVRSWETEPPDEVKIYQIIIE